jgi:hypothetical protein
VTTLDGGIDSSLESMAEADCAVLGGLKKALRVFEIEQTSDRSVHFPQTGWISSHYNVKSARTRNGNEISMLKQCSPSSKVWYYILGSSPV